MLYVQILPCRLVEVPFSEEFFFILSLVSLNLCRSEEACQVTKNRFFAVSAHPDVPEL